MGESICTNDLAAAVSAAVGQAQVTDVHTHLYDPQFGDLLLWGFDELITYHYLIAETMRSVELSYDEYWRLSKEEQAQLIWNTLFIKNSPYSEACRGVLTTLESLGLDVGERDFQSYRQFFQGRSLPEYVDLVFNVANLKCVVMTNDPFNEAERQVWLKDVKTGRIQVDPRFKAALRIDVLLNEWEMAWPRLREWGYNVKGEIDGTVAGEVRRFLQDWIEIMKPVYMAVSLPYNFKFPADTPRAELIETCVLPVSKAMNVPFAPMVGVMRRINPGLQDAGDAVAKMDIGAIAYLCAHFPQNKFLVTLLSRENQHELAVLARKFSNLMPFGCWWFLNNPSLIDEITSMRLELLGTSTILQHSDARVLDQLIYKWAHSRDLIAQVLTRKYSDLMKTGWVVTKEEIQRDVEKLMGGNLWDFLNRKLL